MAQIDPLRRAELENPPELSNIAYWPQDEYGINISVSPPTSESSLSTGFDEMDSFELYHEFGMQPYNAYAFGSMPCTSSAKFPEILTDQNYTSTSDPLSCPYLPLLTERSCECPKWPPAPMPSKPARTEPSSILSNDSDHAQDRDSMQQHCGQCSQRFDNYQALDRHAGETSHKAWRCLESGCSKAYARRDVFLRHRTTHRDGGFRCLACRKVKQYKQFKRKDHLKEHLRKCHPQWNPASQQSQELPNFKQLVENAETKHGFADEYENQQKEQFRVIVSSLKKILPDSHSPLIDRLEDTVDTLDGTTMESLAENMAGAALLQASLTVAKGC